MKVNIKNIGKNNHVTIPENTECSGNFSIEILGNNNCLIIGNNSKLGNGLIEIRNDNSIVQIGNDCLINGWIRCRANDTSVSIGNYTTMMWVYVTLHERGSIVIGDDCMFSGEIRMDVSDMHSILDATTMERINPPGNISIEDHVWVGQGVSILKGSTIGRDAIIGAKSLVASSIPSGVIAAGIPAKVIREGVTWNRKLL